MSLVLITTSPLDPSDTATTWLDRRVNKSNIYRHSLTLDVTSFTVRKFFIFLQEKESKNKVEAVQGKISLDIDESKRVGK